MEIDGSSNDIFMFERSVFSGCRRLRRLMFVESLRRRGIRHALNMRVQLGACAFANCVELRRDNLAFSEIVEMAPDAFAGCVNLDR